MKDTAVLDPNEPVWTRLLKTTRSASVSRPVLSLADQAVVSATNFATAIAVGRFSGEEELGLYSLGFSLVLFGLCVQQALVAMPFTVHNPKLSTAEQPEYAGAVLSHQGVLSALLVIGFLSAAILIGGAFGGVLATLSLATPCVMLREFIRRFLFAHLEIGRALVVDVAVLLVQVSAIVTLGLTETLSAGSAFAASGGACLVAAAGWFVMSRRQFALRGERVAGDAVRSWGLGRWILAGNAALLGQAYAMHWVLAIFVDEAMTGVFAACSTIVDFSNIAVLGLSNLAAPQMARAHGEDGVAGVVQEVRRFTLLLGGFMAVFCLVVSLIGGRAVVWLFGRDYAGNGPTVALLAIAALVYAVGLGPANGLLVIEKAHVNFLATLLGLAMSLTAATILIPLAGVRGAAGCYLIGASVSAAVRVGVFWRTPIPPPTEAP